MSQSAEIKLHELRDKTNRELVSLIGNKLDRGLSMMRALEGDGLGDWAAEEDPAAGAEKSLSEAALWMTLLKGATPHERRRLELKLAQLRDALDRARTSEMRVQTAC